MKIELNSKALEAVSVLCSEESLEVNISLMEDSIDMLLSEQLPETSDQVMDFVRAYRRLSKQLQVILENVKEK